MEREAIIRHLRAWVDGYDPASGAALPLDHPAQRADTLRVLFAAIAQLGAPARGQPAPADEQARGTGGPRNAGRPWTADDDAALDQAFEAGASIAALADGLQRTRGAITARLVKLGRIEPPPGMRLRGTDAPHPEPGRALASSAPPDARGAAGG